MKRQVIRRATAAALTVLLLTTVVAYADTVPADGDAVNPGNQSLIGLDDAAPGEVVTWPVDFRLTCAGLNHVAAGATLTIAQSSASVPLNGKISATTTSIGPVPADWTPAGQGCPSPQPTIMASAPSIVTLTMPTTPGNGYIFTVQWSRAGGSGLTGLTALSFEVNVVPNTPPSLTVPTAITAEATSSAGAAVTWTASATDAQDEPPPTPTCAPASGSTFGLGPTTVTCSVTDLGGLTESGSFLVSVVDTTAPTLVGMPADRSLTTGDPGGTTVIYTSPTANDLADPDPTVDCAPASGRILPIGATSVTCTATDDTGNSSSESFTVDVVWQDPVVWTATWGEPVATTGATFIANTGRTVPVRVEIFADGVAQTSGGVKLEVATCDGATVGEVTMSLDGGRWAAHLDTGRLDGPGCYDVTASHDGSVAGSFRIELRGTPTLARGRRR